MARYNAATALPPAALDVLNRMIMDDGLLGVAVLNGPKHVHEVANPLYERLVAGGAPTYGRPFHSIIDPAIVPEVLLAGVLEGDAPASVREVPCGERAFTSFTFYAVDRSAHSILVVAQDVSELVRARERAQLFTSLTSELLPSVEPRAAVRSVVTEAQRAVGARSSSIFILSDDKLVLHGGAHEWDWTRTSFDVPLADWPTVAAALAAGRPRFITKADAVGAEGGWFESRGTTAALCVPLRADGKAIGVLFFDFDDARRLPMASLDFADSIAAHCAAALSRIAEEPTPRHTNGRAHVRNRRPHRRDA